ncbi:MAG: hypothetical protein M3237_15185 [Actinomycetota bacterium]|nr:hypothetical protein [Actinomycetota bacterium]
MNATLTVPAPALEFEPVGPGVALLEKPVTLSVGPVLAEGGVLDPVGMETYGFVVLRRFSAGSPSELWDQARRTWVPDPGPDLGGAELTQLAYLDAQWKGIVVPAGGEDAAGQPQFDTGPTYSFRAWFESKTGATGLSPATAGIGFVAAGDRNLLVVAPGDGEQADDATEARFALRDTALQEIGSVLIQRDSPGAQITVSNAAGASVVLMADGSIELRPGSGRRVSVLGELEAEGLYQRFGPGGAMTRVAN